MSAERKIDVRVFYMHPDDVRHFFGAVPPEETAQHAGYYWQRLAENADPDGDANGPHATAALARNDAALDYVRAEFALDGAMAQELIDDHYRPGDTLEDFGQRLVDKYDLTRRAEFTVEDAARVLNDAPALGPVVRLVREAVDRWPAFDCECTDEEHEEADCDVNGGDMVEWFGEWRRRAKDLLEQTTQEDAEHKRFTVVGVEPDGTAWRDVYAVACAEDAIEAASIDREDVRPIAVFRGSVDTVAMARALTGAVVMDYDPE